MNLDENGENIYTMYKRVDRKVKPVPGVYPEDTKVIRQFPNNPLDSLPKLSMTPPDFVPSPKLTPERVQKLSINSEGFLWPEEEKLFLHILKLNERTLAFSEADKGTLRSDYFSPYKIPVIPHVPWKERNIPIPPGIRNRVIDLLRDK
ncbi:hypothetical protein K474DRAFT_1610096, partial [Panus rudis PR-1116 ss-1]